MERREEIHIIFFTDPRIGNYECLFEFKMVLHVSVEPKARSICERERKDGEEEKREMCVDILFKSQCAALLMKH